MIRELSEAKKIPTRSYGLSYNVSTLSIDSLVLGGRDRSRYNGNLYESDLAQRNGGGLDVEVESIALTSENGDVMRLNVSTTNFTAILDNTIEQLVLPSSIAAAFQDAVNADPFDSDRLTSSEVQVPPPGKYSRMLEYPESFGGNLTITLRNGFKATIPSEALSKRYLTTEGTVHLSAVLEPKSGQTSGILGVAFLAQAYLSVDYESRKFSLANRVDSEKLDVSPIGCSTATSSVPEIDATTTVYNTAIETAGHSDINARRKRKNILLPVLGSLVGAILILIATLFLLKRYKLKKKAEKRACLTAMAPPPSSRVDNKQLGEYNQVASSSRLWDMGSTRAESEKGISSSSVSARRVDSGGLGLEGVQLPTTPSRVSLAPSTMLGSPARNSYFTEDFQDIVRSPGP